MKRNGYTTIDKSLLKMKNNEIWIYSLLKSFRKKEGYSDLTYKQIEEYGLVTNVDRIIPKLKPYLLKIDQKDLGNNKKQNNYYFKEEKSFIYIDNRFFECKDKNEVKVKGFLIKLKCICISGSNQCNFNKKQICEKLNISRPSLDKYIKLAVDYNWLEEKDGLLITNEYIIKDYVKNNIIELAKDYYTSTTGSVKNRSEFVLKNIDNWNMDRLRTESYILDGFKLNKSNQTKLGILVI